MIIISNKHVILILLGIQEVSAPGVPETPAAPRTDLRAADERGRGWTP